MMLHFKLPFASRDVTTHRKATEQAGTPFEESTGIGTKEWLIYTCFYILLQHMLHASLDHGMP